jgi:hypothetical protein
MNVARSNFGCLCSPRSGSGNNSLASSWGQRYSPPLGGIIKARSSGPGCFTLINDEIRRSYKNPKLDHKVSLCLLKTIIRLKSIYILSSHPAVSDKSVASGDRGYP